MLGAWVQTRLCGGCERNLSGGRAKPPRQIGERVRLVAIADNKPTVGKQPSMARARVAAADSMPELWSPAACMLFAVRILVGFCQGRILSN